MRPFVVRVTPTERCCLPLLILLMHVGFVIAGVACFYPATGGLQYSVSSQENTVRGFRLHLSPSGRSPFGMDFIRPVLDVDMVTNHMVRFTVSL